MPALIWALVNLCTCALDLSNKEVKMFPLAALSDESPLSMCVSVGWVQQAANPLINMLGSGLMGYVKLDWGQPLGSSLSLALKAYKIGGIVCTYCSPCMNFRRENV